MPSAQVGPSQYFGQQVPYNSPHQGYPVNQQPYQSYAASGLPQVNAGAISAPGPVYSPPNQPQIHQPHQSQLYYSPPHQPAIIPSPGYNSSGNQPNVMYDPFYNSQLNTRPVNYAVNQPVAPFVYTNPVQASPPLSPLSSSPSSSSPVVTSYHANVTYDHFYSGSNFNSHPVGHQINPSPASPIHYAGQSNSGPANYPLPFNYNAQVTAPSQLNNNYPGPLLNHYLQHPTAPAASFPSVSDNNNNNNNNYYSPGYSMQMPYQPAPFAQQQQQQQQPQQKYTNYVHPIAPSASAINSVPVANRKFDFALPVTPAPVANSVTKAPATTAKPTAKPLELEMSLEDLFRLAQISNMFSNMSFISMDQIATASDTKVQVKGGNSKVSQGNPSAPAMGEESKPDQDGPIFYGGIFDLSDIEKLKDLIKSPDTSVPTVSRRNEGSSSQVVPPSKSKQVQPAKSKDTSKGKTSNSANSAVNANDLKSLLSKFIQLVPSGDSNDPSDPNGQGGIEIEFNPFSDNSDDENDEGESNNSKDESQSESESEGGEKEKKSKSKSSSNSGGKNRKKSTSKGKSQPKSSNKRADSETGHTEGDEEEVDDENDQTGSSNVQRGKKRRRNSSKKKSGNKVQTVDTRSDGTESTTINTNNAPPVHSYPTNYHQPYAPFNSYPPLPNYNQLPPPSPLAPPPTVSNNQYSSVPYNNYPPPPPVNYGPYNSHAPSHHHDVNYGSSNLHNSNQGHYTSGGERGKQPDEPFRYSATNSDVSKNLVSGSGDSKSGSSNSGKSGNDERGFSSVINVNFPELFKPSHSTVNHDQFDRDPNSNYPIHRRVSLGVMANGLVRRAMRSMAYRLFPTMKNVKFIAAKGCRDVQSIGSLDSIIMPLGLAVTLHPLLLPLVPFFLLALGSIKAVESATCFVSEYFK